MEEHDLQRGLSLSILDDAKLKLVKEIRDDMRRELEETRELRRKIKTFFVGTKEGVCPSCDESKTLIQLKGGITITVCRECLTNSVAILRAAQPVNNEKLLLTLKLQKLIAS